MVTDDNDDGDSGVGLGILVTMMFIVNAVPMVHIKQHAAIVIITAISMI